MSAILLTAFEPFGGDDINPSLEIALRLEGRVIHGHRVVVQILPVAFGHTAAPLRAAMQRLQPALVLAIGQAGGRSELSIERVAINLIDARIADNAGDQPIDAPVIAGAPSAYFASLPVKAIRRALHAQGIPAQLSFSAGSYVCNQVFYLLMHALAQSSQPARGGFIHVPYLPAQAVRHAGAASMALETMIDGIHHAMEAALLHAVDIETQGGTTH